MANITKRKDSYLIRVSCGYDTKGHQIMKSKTWKPSTGMTQHQIKRELNKVAVEFENNVQNGNIAETYKIKFAEFCPIYLEIAENTLAPSTLASYKRYIEIRLLPFFGNMKIKDIKPIHCQSFIQELSTPLARLDKREESLSAGSIQRIFTAMKSIMAKAYKLGYIDTNPTDTARLDIPIIQQPEIDIFNNEEAMHMLKCLESEPLQYKLLIHLAIVTGCRRGELVALQWSCIDHNNKTIEVKQSNYQLKGEAIATKPTKTGVRHGITIPQYIINLLKQHRLSQKEEHLAIGSQWIDEDWIFTQWNGKPMHPHTPSHWFTKFQERHNIPHHKFHALRHTSATLLLTDGANIKTVATRLGHSKLSTTNRYLHSLTSADQAAADTFDKMFSNTGKA